MLTTHEPKDEMPISEAPVTRKSYTEFNLPDTTNFHKLRADVIDAANKNDVDRIIGDGTTMML